MSACPKCGYEMAPLEMECPRCRQLEAEQRTRPQEGPPDLLGSARPKTAPPLSRGEQAANGGAAGAMYGALALGVLVLVDRFVLQGGASGAQPVGAGPVLLAGIALGVVAGAVVGVVAALTRTTAWGTATGALLVGVLKAAGLSGGGLGGGFTLLGLLVGVVYGALFGAAVTTSVLSSVKPSG